MTNRILQTVVLWLLAFTFICFVNAIIAQTGTLSGVVTDTETGETLIGATVMLPELEIGSATDLDGHYQMNNVPTGTHQVRFSYVGYRTVNTTVTITAGNNTLNMEMALDAAGLDEIGRAHV